MASLMTIFEANVPEEDSAELRSRWRELTSDRPEQVTRAWLVRGLDGGDTWCSIAVWPGADALDEYAAAVDAPPAVKSFHAVNARPEFAVFRIIAEA